MRSSAALKRLDRLPQPRNFADAYAGGVTPEERLAKPGAIVFDDMRELPGP